MCKAIRDLITDSEEVGRSEGMEIGRNEGMEIGRSEGIQNSIVMLRKLGKTNEEIIELIMDSFHLEKKDILMYL